MKKNIWKIIDLILFVYCSYVLIYDVSMFINGWTITWFGIIELVGSIILLDILFQEYKKVLKAKVKKVFRVLGVNNIFTTKLYQKNNKNAKGGY